QSALGQVSDAAGRAADAVSSAAAGTKEYVVQEGDDIYSIAMQFDSQPLKIRSLNGGKSLDDLVPGDRILVPAK
ncbi:MAG: LysM peptidoglycan-binding domain-containing protein, partial [Kiritimatiellae bacterium]|nr:LysM peptidoglycan-binding domain-containing protein [Kiritimatiellia bacterium]